MQLALGGVNSVPFFGHLSDSLQVASILVMLVAMEGLDSYVERHSWYVREWCDDSAWIGKGVVECNFCLDKKGIMGSFL